MSNPSKKRLPDGTKVKHEDLHESVRAWTQEIAAKCRNYGMPVGVVVIVVPLDDPKPQWAHNVTPQGAQQLLRRVADDMASQRGGLVVAGPNDLPKA